MLITQLITIPLATLLIAAGGGNCAAPKAQLLFKPTISKVKYNISQSAGDLTGIHGGKAGLVLGLAADPLYYEYQNQYRMYEQDNGKVCVSLDKTKVNFRARPMVFISKEFPRGSCEFNAVLQHENKHVKALKTFQKRYAPRFKKEIESIMEQTRPMSVEPSQIKAAQRKMQETMDRRMKAYLEEIMPKLAREQTIIDSPEEYAKVDAKCDEWNQHLRLE